MAMTACAENGRLRETLQAWKDSISKEHEVEIHKSISDGDRDYKEHLDFRFGYVGKERAFVQYANGEPVELSTVHFTGIEGTSSRLHSTDLAMDQSDLYVTVGEGRSIYCLLTPFDGLGLSGSFQNFAALIAVDVKDGIASAPVGEVVRRDELKPAR
jgi:hypothetical protein